LTSLKNDIEEIECSSFAPVADPSLTLHGNFSQSNVKLLSRSENVTELMVFESVLGQLIEEKILPQLNANMRAHVHSHPHQQHRRYHDATSLDLKAYFLKILLEGIRTGRDHEPTDSVIAAACERLVDKNRVYVFNSELAFGDAVLADILEAVPLYIRKLVEIGSCVVIDEALSSYYGPEAKAAHKLRHIPEKPHQDGLLTYILCQRLPFTGRAISVAFAPTYFNRSITPRDALVQMIVSLERAGIRPSPQWCFVADSLWSFPSYIQEFISLGWRFVISAKENCSLIPKALRNLAAEDLILAHSRTYTDGFLTLQAYQSERGITNIITNAAGLLDRDPNADIPIISYKTALSLFQNDKPGSIVSFLGLPTTSLTQNKPALVHQITGWDVLREPSRQGDTSPLTKERLNKFSADQVAAIYHLTFRRNPPSSATKGDMIAALCPDDDRHEARHISKRRLDRQTLEARRVTLQGQQSTDHRIYDIFHKYYACIDQMDREFYQGGLVRHQHHANRFGLSVILFYLMSTCHSIFEEYKCSKLHAQSGGNNAQARAYESISYADYVLAVTNQFKAAHPDLHPRTPHH
jgi:hypothetical protein